MAKLLRKKRAKDSGISSNKNDNPKFLCSLKNKFVHSLNMHAQ